MTNSSIEVRYEARSSAPDRTQHGMLPALWQYAEQCGAFQLWEQIKFKMKTVEYSPTDKLKVLWASIVTGCEHTSYINDRFGACEKALAQATLNKGRFPDQSQINRLLQAVGAEQIEGWRAAHFELLRRHSRGRQRKHWTRLSNRQRVLTADVDQRGIAVNGKQFELATKGYFSRQRTRRGYQLSALFLSSQVGEVLNEYFDSGDTPAARRLPELIGSLGRYCQQMKISPDQVLIRGDAQFGTPAVIGMIEAAGFRYLFRGLCPQKAAKLAEQATEPFWQVKRSTRGEPLWLSEVGLIEHADRSTAGRGQKIRCRTIVEVRLCQAKPVSGKHHGKKKAAATPTIRYSYFLTNLNQQQMPCQQVLDLYHDRATIERYFNDEQNALGAKHVRTKHFYGAGLFQFMVATTNNLLRWAKSKLFGGTKIELLGLKRFIRQVIEVPSKIRKEGKRWFVQLPKEQQQIKWMIDNFSGLSKKGGMALALEDG